VPTLWPQVAFWKQRLWLVFQADADIQQILFLLLNRPCSVSYHCAVSIFIESLIRRARAGTAEGLLNNTETSFRRRYSD